MPKVTFIQGEQVVEGEAHVGTLVGDIARQLGLALEQPCAGRGTCGLCKILDEGGLAPPDDIERQHLTPGEIALGNRLACRARIAGDARVVLAPVVVYSNKVFRASKRYLREPDVPLGVAIDLGSTTVAAFLTMLDDGEVCMGSASLNQQSVYGADVISRLAAAQRNREDAGRLQRLALSSINQAVDGLRLTRHHRQRVERVVIVSNPAMHHLLLGYPVESLAQMPFQPHQRKAIEHAEGLLSGIFLPGVQVMIPPLIGGFVGSDALACLAYFGFNNPPYPMVTVDLGTNGEVMVTDGERILTASTAAGPAFEGVNIACGSRAVDGAITAVRFEGDEVRLQTIGDEPPLGMTGSGLISAVYQFSRVGWIEPSGRVSLFAPRTGQGEGMQRAIPLTADGRVYLTQADIRELQKAKGAIRAAIDVLMGMLNLAAQDIGALILTGSFGGQVDIDAVLGLGMIPPVSRDVVHTIPNGAGMGAALFLRAEGWQLAKDLAQQAEQIDLDLNRDFLERFVDGMRLSVV